MLEWFLIGFGSGFLSMLTPCVIVALYVQRNPHKIVRQVWRAANQGKSKKAA